jgi:dsDNA-specific endonuclease/ATPase MutS2
MDVGDKVKFLNENITGEIVTKSTKYFQVKCDDDFIRKCLHKEVIKVKEENESKLLNSKPIVKNIDIKHQQKSKVKLRQFETSIDLHIECLIDDHRQMTNGEILMLQIRRFEEKMRKSIAHNYQRLIVIHGMGKGVLKSEIHHILIKKYPFEFMDAPYTEYGYGATLVLLKTRRVNA